MGIFFGSKQKKNNEDKEKPMPVTTPTGAVVPPSHSDIPWDALKGVIEGAVVNQPQLTEHVTGQVKEYLTEIVNPEFRDIFAKAIAPAVLLSDASDKELADLLAELYVNRLRFTGGPRFVSKRTAMDFDLQYAAVAPIVRLARNSHLLHVVLRYGPVVVRE